jgi:hypothetical protein
VRPLQQRQRPQQSPRQPQLQKQRSPTVGEEAREEGGVAAETAGAEIAEDEGEATGINMVHRPHIPKAQGLFLKVTPMA